LGRQEIGGETNQQKNKEKQGVQFGHRVELSINLTVLFGKWKERPAEGGPVGVQEFRDQSAAAGADYV
jgi:hypothetical protein